MSGWWKSLPNGLPNVVSPPKSGHRRAGKGREFPWRCNVDTIAMDLKVSWEMSVKRERSRECSSGLIPTFGTLGFVRR